ncbi:MAG: LamG-like jellyroll fold domain-containing protein [Phycisphaerales bacterium]
MAKKIILLILFMPALAFSAIVAQYHFDGNLLDSAPAGSTADNLSANTGSAVYTTGVLGSALQTGSSTGSAAFVYAADSADLDLAGQFTIEAFIYPESLSNQWSRVILKWNNTTSYHLALNYANAGLHITQSNGTSLNNYPAAITVGQWYHIAAVGNGSYVTIYLNGVAKGSFTYNGTLNNTAESLTIGGSLRNNDYLFDGKIDEVILHNDAKSPSYLIQRASLLLGPVQDQNNPKFAADINNDGIVNFLDLAAFADSWLPDAFTQFNNAIEELRYFAMPMSENVMLEKHLFAFSGRTAVNPMLTKAGFQKIYSPPYCASTFAAEFKPFNASASPVNYIWYPSEFYADFGEINNVKIESTLVPLSDANAIIYAVKFTNATENSISIPCQFLPSGSISSTVSTDWGWTPPASSGSPSVYVQNNKLIMDNNGLAICVAPNISSWTRNGSAMSADVALNPEQTRIIYIITSFGELSEVETSADAILSNPQSYIADTRQHWYDEINQLTQRSPKLQTDNSDLKIFYDRGLFTLLTCKWTSPSFCTNPWYSESGIDGGAVCNYIWGTSYIGNCLAMIDPNAMKSFLLLFLNGDLLNHYAITPLNGSATGPNYSYNKYSLSSLLYSYVMLTGDTTFLTQSFNGSTILDAVSAVCLYGEDLESDPVLANYGLNSNLLELKKTTAYQYYVPSPNAERCLIYEQLAKLYTLAGITAPADLNERSAALKTVIRNSLWSSSKNWFNAHNAYNISTTAYSLQIFDLLRTGVPTSLQASGLISHLNSTEFLSKYGIHSLSKTDSGYDTTDVDWGGPGVYAGDAPQIIEDLYFAGYNSQAQEILGKILWWGKTFPYYPQAIYADQRYYRTDGRANVIAGLTASQCIIFGVFGVNVQSDRIIINPHSLDFANQLELSNIRIRNKILDIAILPSSGTFIVTDGDDTFVSNLGTAVTIMF